MPYYLKLHFDPDADPDHLRPALQDDGSVDHYELNFVHNVEAGDVIAEWIEADEWEALGGDVRFVFEEKQFPAGKGTGIKRMSPNVLFSAVNGRVCYQDGTIVVWQSLTVHKDIDFHTGNIDFVGDLTVEGSIRSGFSARARNLIVCGQVEGARIEALRNLDCRGGVKGSKEAFLEVGHTAKLAFAEYATIKTGQDLLVKGSLMHSNVYVGKRLAVGGRATGGTYYCQDFAYIGEQLGGGLDTNTSLVLGYAPGLLHADAQYDMRIARLLKEIHLYEQQLDKPGAKFDELSEKLESANAELEQVKLIKARLWMGINSSERIDKCRVLVPGIVKPGVEISIGSAYLKVDDFLEDVYFYFDKDEVKIGNSAKKIKI